MYYIECYLDFEEHYNSRDIISEQVCLAAVRRNGLAIEPTKNPSE
jgi:hypothetical protein